jgi:hypothetical protein
MPSFVRLARHHAYRRHALRAHVRWLADVAENAGSKRSNSLAGKYVIVISQSLLPVADVSSSVAITIQ